MFKWGIKSACRRFETNSVFILVLCCVHGTNTSAGSIKSGEGERSWDKIEFFLKT